MNTQTLTKFRHHYKKGDVLLREGELDSQILLPEKGILDIYIQGRKVNSIDSSTSQDFIGEVGAILGVPRTATVTAATDCVVICLPRIELEALMKNAPSLGVKLVLSLCRKLLNSTTTVAESQSAGTSILQSGNTEVSLKNYMKGLLSLMELASTDRSGKAGKCLLDYFLKTNPWGILHGDPAQLLPDSAPGQHTSDHDKE